MCTLEAERVEVAPREECGGAGGEVAGGGGEARPTEEGHGVRRGSH